MNIYELDKLIESLKKDNHKDNKSLIDFYLRQRKILINKIYDQLDIELENIINSGVSTSEWKKQQKIKVIYEN